MPKGYRHTREAKEKISEASKGRKCSEDTKRKMSESRMGHIVTEDTRKKISKKLMGMYKCEHRSPGTEWKKGRIPWNKNGTHSDKSKIKMSSSQKELWKNPEYREHMSNAHMGHKAWNKGMKGGCLSDNHKEKIRVAMTDRKITWGDKISKAKKERVTDEFREKMRQINLGKQHTEETKMKLKELRKYKVFPKKDSSIEVKIQNFLKKLGIEFFTHQYINIKHGYQCDILIPSMNMVIECDGDYWHRYPIGRDIDRIRTSELLEKGFKVLRLWEYEIRNMDLNKFKERLG